MRMVLHRARPGMEDRHDAECAADPGAIGGERLDGGRGFAQQHGVHGFLMRPRDGTEFTREREGEQEVIAGEQASAEALEPRLGAIVLTRGAVPVAAGVIRVLERAAVATAVERAAERRGALSRAASPPNVGEQRTLTERELHTTTAREAR